MTLTEIRRIADAFVAWIVTETAPDLFRLKAVDIQEFILPIIHEAAVLGNLEILADPDACRALNLTIAENPDGYELMDRNADAFLLFREVTHRVRARQRHRRTQ